MVAAPWPPDFDSEPFVDPQATFVKRFGDLVALLRVDPGNDAAQDLALTAAAAAVEHHAIVVESGVERVGMERDGSLQARLRARRVDLLRVSAGTEPHELLSLARALSHDQTPIPACRRLRIELIPEPPSPGPDGYAEEYSAPRVQDDRRRWRDRRYWRAERWRGPERRRGSDRRLTGERRLRLLKLHEGDVDRLKERLARAVASETWADVLETAHALLDAAAYVPAAERRSFALGVRRYLPRPALGGVIDLALHDAAERERAVTVLRWTGLEGADAMVDVVRASESVGSRRFLHDALGGMPEAFPAVAPLLNSAEPHEVRHAAGILGKMGRSDAVGPLRECLAHSDASVRAAVLLALAEFPLRDVVDALRSTLGHPVAETRAAAADAIGRTRAPGLVMPLAAALDGETDDGAWRAMVNALATLASPEACAALTSVALSRRRLLGGGHVAARRIEAVRALAAVGTPCRTPSLERVAREGDDAVRRAAEAALAAREGRSA